MEENKTKSVFANNLAYFMKMNKVDRNTLSRDLGIKYTTICEWLKGNTMPRSDKLDALADYFGIDASDFLSSVDQLREDFCAPVIDFIPKDMTLAEAKKTHIVTANFLLRKLPNTFQIIITHKHDPEKDFFEPSDIIVFEESNVYNSKCDLYYVKRKGHDGEIACANKLKNTITMGTIYSQDNNEDIYIYDPNNDDVQIIGKLIMVGKQNFNIKK